MGELANELAESEERNRQLKNMLNEKVRNQEEILAQEENSTWTNLDNLTLLIKFFFIIRPKQKSIIHRVQPVQAKDGISACADYPGTQR